MICKGIMVANIAEYLLIGCLIWAVCLAPPVLCNAIEPYYYESFEDPYYRTTNWKESDTYWYTRASIGSEVPLEDFAWEITVINDYGAPNGEYCVELTLDGQHEQGVVWLEKQFQYPTFQATTSILFQGSIASNWEGSTPTGDILMYIGTDRPNDELDLRGADNEGLATEGEVQNGWKDVSKEFAMRVTQNTTLYLALGVSITSQGNQTYYIDNLYWLTFTEPEAWQEFGRFLVFIFSVLPAILPPLVIIVILIISVSFLLKRRLKKQ